MESTLENLSNFLFLVHPFIIVFVLFIANRTRQKTSNKFLIFFFFIVSLLGGFVFFWSVFIRDGLAVGMIISTGNEAFKKSMPGILIGGLLAISPYVYLIYDIIFQKKSSSKFEKMDEDILDAENINK